MKCSFNNCLKRGRFAIFKLNTDGTKEWLTDLCDYHERLIYQQNQDIKREYPDLKFKEVKR